MATNRLFVYDPDTNTAVCIAKGYSNGWLTFGESDYQNKFYNNVIEFTGGIKSTRLQLKTEVDLPCECKILWKEEARTQKEKFITLLKEFGIGFNDNGLIVRCEQGMEKVDGYYEFSTEFEFDADGNFIKMGAMA